MPREFKSLQAVREEHERLKADLAALAAKRAAMKSEKERLTLIPEAVRRTTRANPSRQDGRWAKLQNTL
jgi:hypothetical protein